MDRFTLQTDSKSVVGFLANKEIDQKHSAKQIRDKLNILAYQDRMKIEHISGKRNFIADSLTRKLSYVAGIQQAMEGSATFNPSTKGKGSQSNDKGEASPSL